jgi:hypothetical protein
MQAASLVPMQGSVMMKGIYMNSAMSLLRCSLLTATGVAVHGMS